MRRLSCLVLFACSSTLAACSGDGFELAAASPDTAVEEDAGEPHVETNDAAPEDASDAGDADEANDANDATAATDASDANTSIDAADAADAHDAADTRAPDTCAPNACGGCTMLTNAPGTACGACGDGKWACDGANATKCVGARALNACGGCATLANALGTACGVCAGGTYVCNGVDATKCSDPVTTPPGTACGTCGTSKYVCAPDGKSTVCSKPDDRNACGGCGTLAGVPATGCEGCGVWTCTTDKGSVFCKAAATAPGTTCGTCMRSKFACTAPGVTACELPDDRKAVSWGPGEMSVGAEDVVSPRLAHGVEVTAAKSGEITDLQVAILRRPYNCPDVSSVPHPDPSCTSCRYSLSLGKYSCSVEAPVTGMLTATIWIGYPGALGAKAQAFIPADGTILSAPGTAWINFKLATPLTVSVGQKLYVELTSTSTAYEFTWNRSPWSSTIYDRLFTRAPGSDTTWTAVDKTTRPLKVVTKTCDY